MRHPTQDPKYGIENNALVNMATGKPIPLDEPVFMLRAKDIHAMKAILIYAELCTNDVHWAAVRKRAGEFLEFETNHKDKMKEPDTQ